MLKKLRILCLLFLISLSAKTQVSITTLATPYTQDFNTLDLTTTPSSVLPTGWLIFETGTNADQKYIGDNGTVNSGNTYSYGTTSATDRAFGGLQSGSLAPVFGLKFQNNSGSTITSLTVTFTGEQWRLGVTGGRKDTLDFQYGIGNADLATGPWTDVDGLDFTTPNTSAAAGATDGNAAGNKTTLTLTISSLSIANGDVFYIRFSDRNISGSDDGLGIDDLSVNFNGAAPTPCTTPTAQPTALSLTPTPSSISGSFTAASPAPTSYLVVYSTSATLSTTPVDGTTYTAGTAFGGGIIAQYGSATTFNLTGLTATTPYFVFVFSANSAGCTGGPKYLATSPLNGTTTTTGVPACTTPTAAATNLILTPSSTSVTGTFTASSTANNYLIVRSTVATLSATPVNGTTYVAGAAFGGGTVVQYNNTTSFSVTGLTSNTQYYFFVFAANGSCTGEPFYLTTALNGSTTTLNNSTTGYYSGAAGLSCQALKTALYNKISTGTSVLSYTPGVWNAYQTTDLVRNFENNRDIIYDMYSNKGPGVNEPYEFVYGTNQCGNYNSEADCYNREHSMPQSWFNSASPMVSDIHHIVPTDGYVNGQRGNFAFGPVGTATYTSQNGSKKGNCSYPGFTGTVFEPINEFKGDFARMQFYMAVRYENVIGSWQNNGNANDVLDGSSYQVFDAWYLKMLYDWHIQDPVSAKEIARNNAVFAIQGNRNPFIDSAQYVFKIWSCTGLLPAPVTTPIVLNVSNKCINDATARGKVSNPPAGVTVSVTLDGATITYATADSTFQYFTSAVTPAGTHLVKVTFTNALGSAFKDTSYTVAASLTPTNSISGVTTVFTGQVTTLTATPTDGGTTPAYQWQDSTSATGWTNIAGAINSSIIYNPAATGNKIRCRLTSNAAGCVNTTPVFSNVLTFTVSTATAINPVSGTNYGIVLAPNPVRNTINLSGLKTTDKWQTAEIITIEGKAKVSIKNIVNRANVSIDVHQLPSGMYILVLKRTTGANAFVKFVKL
jgi:endonuclease I